MQALHSSTSLSALGVGTAQRPGPSREYLSAGSLLQPLQALLMPSSQASVHSSSSWMLCSSKHKPVNTFLLKAQSACAVQARHDVQDAAASQICCCGSAQATSCRLRIYCQHRCATRWGTSTASNSVRHVAGSSGKVHFGARRGICLLGVHSHAAGRAGCAGADGHLGGAQHRLEARAGVCAGHVCVCMASARLELILCMCFACCALRVKLFLLMPAA